MYKHWKLGISVAIPMLLAWTAFFGVWLQTSVLHSDKEGEDFVIGMPYEMPDVSVLDPDEAFQHILLNTHEGLVWFDENMKIVPLLARSWGRVDDTTWEFKLRRDAIFHNGEPMQAEDVINTFAYYKENQNASHYYTVKDLRLSKVDAHIIRIHTQNIDPILLNKLTQIPILSAKDITKAKAGDEGRFYGTGPYKVSNMHKDTSRITLIKNQNYWGDDPDFETAYFVYEPNKYDRKDRFLRGDIDLLASVPQDIINLPKQLKDDFRLVSKSGLETKFFVLNAQEKEGNPFQKIEMRKAFAKTLDRKKLVSMIDSGYAHLIDQPIPTSLLWYNPDYNYKVGSGVQVADVLHKNGYENGVGMNGLFNEHLQLFSQYITSMLREHKIIFTVDLATHEDFVNTLSKASHNVYFMGWSFTEGDVQQFLESFVHSKGSYNPGLFGDKQEEINRKIEKVNLELSLQKRKTMLYDIFATLLDNYYIIPFFEEEKIYAIKDSFVFQGRQDGFIYIPGISID